MSRSEHATRREPRDPGDRARKRRVKELARDRVRPAVTTEGGAVPITVEDGGPFVHHTSIDDLRAVMARLPPGMIDGLGSIALCVGMIAEGDDDPDPMTGRPGIELAAGVYSPRLLGRYSREGARIQLFAYVYDPVRADRTIVELYLRLKQLATFVHELGHHRDFTTRVARGRWRADDVDELETYAEAIEYEWTRDVIVPYLEDVYPDAVAELRRWLERHGGVALPLELLAGDPRTASGEASFFGADTAFERLLRAVGEGTPPPASHVDLAEQLHFGGHYEEALAILERVLAAWPDHADALTLQADIFVHQRRFADAAAIARAVVERDDAQIEAWRVLADAASALGEWAVAVEAAERAVTDSERAVAGSERGWQWRHDVAVRARARTLIGDLDGAARDLDLLEASARWPREHRVLQVLRAIWLLARGDHAAALELATRGLTEPPRRMFLVAVQSEAALHLGLPYDQGELPATCDALRYNGFTAWAARLEALHAARG